MRDVGLTVGVEEEFLLLDPDGTAAPVAGEVVRRVDDERVKPELMTYQVETATDVCTDLVGLEDQLSGLRRGVAAAAERSGARLVAVGAPPWDDPGPEFLTDATRYHHLAVHDRRAVAASGTCACQVHVGIDDRELAVRVLARLRPWLPALFALSPNSPMTGGRDSGWSSTRYAKQARWPTFTAAEPWRTFAEYERAVKRLVDNGDALDARGVYFLARLSPRYPTIEIRVADTALEAADAVLLAGVCRALVASLAEDVRQGRAPDTVSGPDLRADLMAVAHHGLPDLVPAQRAPTATRPTLAVVVARLLRQIQQELDSTGDTDRVLAGLARLTEVGTGCERQRGLLALTTRPEDLVAAMAAATVSEQPWPRRAPSPPRVRRPFPGSAPRPAGSHSQPGSIDSLVRGRRLEGHLAHDRHGPPDDGAGVPHDAVDGR